MSKWTADYVNDPRNDFEIVVEIRCNDLDVAIIRQGGTDDLEIEWYPHDESLVIPFSWLFDLFINAKKDLKK